MPRPRQILRWLLRLALGLVVLYVAGANLLLASGLLPRLINSPRGTLAVEWGSAWTLLPGRVHVRDFRLRGTSGTRAEFEVRLERARVRVDLPALLHRQFHAWQVQAEGASTRVRFPFQPGEERLLARDRALLPEIAGFAPPRIVPGPRAPPRAGARHPPWQVRLDDVSVERITEAWVQQFHWQGVARAGGSFELQPLRKARVGPAWAELAEGRVRLGPAGPAVAEHTRGPVRLSLRPFAFGQAGREGRALAHVDGEADLAANAPDLDWIEHFVPALDLNGTGTMRVHPILRDGLLLEGSRVDVRSEGAEVRAAGLVARGDVRLEARATAQETYAEVKLGPAHLEVAGQPQARAELQLLSASLRDGQLDLTRLPYVPALQLRVEGARTEDLGAWSRALQVPAVAFARGRATFGGELRAPPGGPGEGQFRLQGRDLQIRVGGVRASGRVGAVLHLRGVDRHTQSADVSGSRLELKEVSVTPMARDTRGWWARAEVVSGQLKVGPGVPSFSGEVRASGRDARPLLDLLAQKGTLPGFVARQFSLPGVQASSNVRLSGRSLAAEPFRIAGGRTEIVGRLRVQGRTPTGAVLIRSGHLRAGIDLTGPKASLKLLDADRWFRRQLPPRAAPPRN